MCKLIFTATVAVGLSLSIASAPAAGFDVRLVVPPAVGTYTPLWWTIEITGGRELASPDKPFYADLDPPPAVSLREGATGKHIRPFAVLPHKVGGHHLVSLGGDLLRLTGDNTFRKRYLLNETYGILPPGEYELAVRVYLTVTAERAKLLPGRAAPEKGTISAGSVLLFWELPEQRARFEVTAATPQQGEALVQRVEGMMNAGKANHLRLDDWLSLLLVNTEPAWRVLTRHVDQAPSKLFDTLCWFLLNDGDDDQAIERATPLLASRHWWVYQTATEVIERRGNPRDALLLRPNLPSTDQALRRTTYVAIARMLGKQTPPDLGRRRVSNEDVQAALKWLEGLPPDGSAPER